MLSPRTPAGRTARRGAATVEFALVAGIFFFFLFSCIEFGRMNTVRQTVNNAAYEAARKCVVPGAVSSEGQDAAKSILTAVGIRGSTVEVTIGTTAVTAKVTTPLAANLWVRPVFFSEGSVSSTCTLTIDWVVSTRKQ